MTHLNLTRIFAYIAGILPALQQLAPSIMPAPWGVIGAAAAGIVLTAGHQLHELVSGAQAPAAGPAPVPAPIAPAAPAGSATAGVMFIALSLLAAVGGLAGCTTLNGAINAGTTQTMLIQDAVELGTMGAILSQPAGGQASTAQGIIAAATAVEGLAVNDSVTVAQLDQQLATILAKTKLSPPVQATLLQVAQIAVAQISTKVNQGLVSSSSTSTVTTVMAWIIAGATPYAGTKTAGPVVIDEHLALLIDLAREEYAQPPLVAYQPRALAWMAAR